MSMVGGRSVAVAASLLLVLRAGTARAEGSETDRQVAQSLFDDGRVLLEAGRYAEACPKFADSQRLDPGGGTLLNLAVCHELEGKTATAWAEFRDALSIAMRDERRDRQDLASLHIAALGPRLMRLMVVVSAPVASSDPEVTLDRSRLPAAAWNTAIPIDPGEHRIAIAVTGLPLWEASVTASEAGHTYRVEVPVRDRPEPCPLGLERRGATCVAAQARPEVRHRSTAFWVVLGGAGVSLAASVVTGLLALDANATANARCSESRDFCRDDAASSASRARTLAWASTVTLLAGAAGATIAFVLPLEKTPFTAVAVSPSSATIRW